MKVRKTAIIFPPQYDVSIDKTKGASNVVKYSICQYGNVRRKPLLCSINVHY